MSQSGNNAKKIAENATDEAAVTSTLGNDKKKQENGSSGPIFLFFLSGWRICKFNRWLGDFPETPLLSEKTTYRF